MAWDFIGTEFGNRRRQYGKFQGGVSFPSRSDHVVAVQKTIDVRPIVSREGQYDIKRVDLKWNPTPCGFGAPMPHKTLATMVILIRYDRRVVRIVRGTNQAVIPLLQAHV